MEKSNGNVRKKPFYKEDSLSWQSVAFAFIVYVGIGTNAVLFSVLYIYITDYFESNKAIIGWIGSTQRGTLWMFGMPSFSKRFSSN